MTGKSMTLGVLGALSIAPGVAHAQDNCTPEWSSVGGGADMVAGVYDLKVFDEGRPGPAPLFAGGGFQNFAGVQTDALARWDGWRASEVGLGLPPDVGVWALLPVGQNVGLIPSGLYAAGDMFEAGAQPVNNLARWDGQAWHDVGGGLTSPDKVFGFALCIFDEDGDGPLPPALFVGGQFWYAGGVPAEGLARWDGQAWSSVGGGLSLPNSHPSVYSMAVYDDGRGPALYVGGSFYQAGGIALQNIARWDGQAWESLGGPNGGVTAEVEALCVYDEDGDGPGRSALFVGGQFSFAGGKPIKRLVRWNGKDWSPVGAWPGGGAVRTAAVWKSPDDERANLYVGGFFYHDLPDGTLVRGIARWDGQAWRDVDYGVDGYGQMTNVSSLSSFDEDGDGPNPGGLYVGGGFLFAGSHGLETHHIARWGCPLGPRCDADLDRNGSLDLFDFLTFLNLFNAEDPTADCTADGSLDLFDFLCFTNAFNAGCP